MRTLLCFALLASLGAPAVAGEPGFKLVVNAANPASSMSKEQAAKIFLKKSTQFEGGLAAAPVDLPSASPVRARFTEVVLGKSPAAVRTYWNRMVFSGIDTPPPEKASDADVIAFVRSTPGGIGYVSAAAELAGVKELALR
jgi:ABC-type phosphate transport system substrate-binding protein